jgi:hypothetical protein
LKAFPEVGCDSTTEKGEAALRLNKESFHCHSEHIIDTHRVDDILSEGLLFVREQVSEVSHIVHIGTQSLRCTVSTSRFRPMVLKDNEI